MNGYDIVPGGVSTRVNVDTNQRRTGEAESTYFPPDIIPSEEKGYEWHLAYSKAAWLEYTSLVRGSLYMAHDRYATIMAHLQGEYGIEKFRAQLEIGDEDNEAWVNLDWSPVKWLAGLRDAAIARVSKRDYTVSLTPIDPLAAEERAEALRKMEARLLIRKTIEKVAPGDSENTQFAQRPGEPSDNEELQLMKDFTYKHNMAMQAEQLVDVILNENKYNEIRRRLKEDLFAFGVAGVKEYINSAGVVKVRRVLPHNAMTSPCQNNDYSDIRYAGEVRRILVADLMEEAGDQFSTEQYIDIARNNVGRFGNPTPVADEALFQNFKDYKIEVLDLEWFSIQGNEWEFRTNRFGNTLFSHAKPGNRREKNRYVRRNFKVVHSSSWIIGSNYMYNWGLATNMKRKTQSMEDTTLSYHFRATDFYQNRVVSMAERLIPFSDQCQKLWLKMQMLTHKLRDDGYAVELGSLEDIDLGQGGGELQPMDVLDLFHQKGYLLYRRLDLAGDPKGWMPITELRGSDGQQLNMAWNKLLEIHEFMKRQIGFNDLVDGTTYDPRALKTAVAAAQESSNNALWKLVVADYELMEELCDSVMQRGQAVIRAGGKITGYTTAVGSDTIAFFEASPELSMYDFGLKLDNLPTEEERQQLIAEAQNFVAAGDLDLEDLALLKNAANLKQAQMILAIRVKKRRAEKEEMAKEQIKYSGEVQQQNTMVEGQVTQQKIAAEHQSKMQQIELEFQLRYKIAEMEAAARLEEVKIQAQASMLRQGAASVTKLTQEGMKQDAVEAQRPSDNQKEQDNA